MYLEVECIKNMNLVDVHNALSSNNGFLSSRLDFDGEWSKSSDDSKLGVTSSSGDCCKLSASSCGELDSVFLGDSSLTVYVSVSHHDNKTLIASGI